MGDFVDMLNSHRFEDYLEAETITDNVDERSPLNVFVPPDELGVVLDYAVSYRAWLDRINERDQPENLWQIIDDLGLEISGGVSIDMDTREQPGRDGAVVLYLSSGSINASAEVTVIETGEVQPWEIHMSWDGLCTTGYAQIYDDFEDFEVCIDPEDWPGDEDEIFIVVKRVDGDWYISYVETTLAYIRLFLDDYLSNADGAGVNAQSDGKSSVAGRDQTVHDPVQIGAAIDSIDIATYDINGRLLSKDTIYSNDLQTRDNGAGGSSSASGCKTVTLRNRATTLLGHTAYRFQHLDLLVLESSGPHSLRRPYRLVSQRC